MQKTKVVTTEDVLTMFCSSVVKVLTSATQLRLGYSPMIQKINRTCLRPDIGCFVLFDGGFSGLVVVNFSAAAALEIYQTYLRNMGLPQDEISTQHTSDDVGNVLGELMNQIVGDFIGSIGKKMMVSLKQNQPKMLTITKEVMISIDTNLDRPQMRRVSFNTAGGNVFYMELAMDKTEFVKLHDFEFEDFEPDQLLEQNQPTEGTATRETDTTHSDLMDELGI
ncbi:DUF3334 family protein [Ectothiorhodospiraceae bacterium BW-2]|nr:DUF3334 family protein [Ectothiorhodospiraceae bacterium BW-2]